MSDEGCTGSSEERGCNRGSINWSKSSGTEEGITAVVDEVGAKDVTGLATLALVVLGG